MAKRRQNNALMRLTPTKAYVAWDGEDDTAAVHAAIATGRGEIIFREQSSEYVVGPITLQSNQKLIFHPGANVIAKEGSFTGLNDRLFYASGKQNISFIGHDVTFTMLRGDYTTEPPYTDSETFTADTDDILTLAEANATILVVNTIVKVSTAGTLPAGLSASASYYVRAISGATCKLSTTASDVGIVNITDAGSGTHTITKSIGENRLGIGLYGCQNIHISGVTVEDCGGDGLYVGGTGGCVNVTVKNCTFQNNWRNNISVVAVDGLLMEDVSLITANGTSPESGITFEPNVNTAKLSRIVLRRVTSTTNVRGGFNTLLTHLDNTSADIDMLFEDCVSNGDCTAGTPNGRGAFYVGCPNATPPGGLITVNNMTIVDSVLSGITITDKPAAGPLIEFHDCIITNPAASVPTRYPIFLTLSASSVNALSGVVFDNVTITDAVERNPIESSNSPNPDTPITDITGTLIWNTVSTPLTTETLNGWLAEYETATPP